MAHDIVDRRVHSRPGAGSERQVGSLPSRVAGSTAGLRAGARHEHREHVHRLHSVLAALGVRATLASRLVLATYVALGVATVFGALAPSVRTAVPAGGRWLVPPSLLLVLCLLGVGLTHHLARTTRRHRTLLLALPAGARRGLLAGLSLNFLPAGVVLVCQVARGGLADLTVSLGLLLDTALDATGAADSTSLGARWGIGLVVATAAGLLTWRASSWIGDHGLGPRLPAAHRSSGRTVGLFLGLGWAGATALETTTRFAVLGQHLLLSTALVATLLLRARHIRFMSPETFGYGLCLAERTGANPRRIAALSRRNSLLLLAPGYLGAALLLMLAGSAFTVALLTALAVLEFTLAEFIVQRSTVVLPVSQLPQLTVESKAGLAAALCLGVVFTTTGSGGMFTVVDFGSHRVSVFAVSLLLIASAVTIAWIVRIDTPRWLTGLRATFRSVP